MRRAAPGTQVGQGRLRVDAARAITKLREYQLANRVGWVLEGIRAAVAAGATRIDLRGDSNDVWLAWDGEPWDPAQLPRLFDELVSPDSGDAMQHVRLLASAVNNALGLEPAYVDVYAITAPGTAQRARYTPDVLAEPENELGEAALRHVGVTSHEPPTQIARGMLVHVRRAFGLGVLSNLFSGAPELPVAVGACRDLPVPLTVDGTPVERHREVIRVPLGDELDGYVAITEEDVAAGDVLEVAERGVVLARYELDILGYSVRGRMPVRVHLNADRLPTNVSRSQVRRDVHPISTAERRAKSVIADAVAALARETSAAARTAACALLATLLAGHPSRWGKPPKLLEPLARRPLVKNAYGDERPIAHDWASVIHSERGPLDRDLEPWLGEVLWVPPGDEALKRLLGDHTIDVAAMRTRVRDARKQRRAQAKFLAHDKRDLVVKSSAYSRVRYTLGASVAGSGISDDVFADVAGEVCVYSESKHAAITLCIDGRELERVELESPLAFDAVVDSQRLVPGERYRGVARDAGFDSVLRAVRAGVVRALERVASESRHLLDADRPLLREGLVLMHEVGFALRGPLTEAPLWRTVGGSYASFAQLAASDYVGVIGEDQTLVPLKQRIVVHASVAESTQLRRIFGKRVISYHKAAGRDRRDLAALADAIPRFSGAAALVVHDGDISGVVALAGKSARMLFHCGLPLGEQGYGHTLVPCIVAIDDDRLAPNEKWSAPRDDAGLAGRKLDGWERALMRAIARTLLGQRPAALVTPGTITVGDANFQALAAALVQDEPVDVLGADLVAELRAAKLFTRIGSSERLSIDDLVTAGPTIWYIDRDAAPAEGLAPVGCDDVTARMIGRLADRVCVHAGNELERLERAVTARRRMERHMEQLPRPLELTSELPTVALSDGAIKGIVGVTNERPAAAIFVHERPFTVLHPEVGYPLTAVVALDPDRCTAPFDSVTTTAIDEIVEAMRDAVPRLLEAIGREHPAALVEPGPACRLFVQYVGSHKKTADRFEHLKLFATLQGERCAISELESPIKVASFADEWLPPSDGEGIAPLDGPVLRVAGEPDDVTSLIGWIARGKTLDVTEPVMRLQSRRRMSRGLLPTPKLDSVRAELKRPLSAFGPLAARLGHGEVGFLETPGAKLLIHDQGQLKRTYEIDVMPAIALAVEEPARELDHASMIRVAQDLAVELVRTALPADLSPPLRANLARALLARRLPPAALGAAAIFLCADGRYVGWPTVYGQIATYDEVWAVPPTATKVVPLDANRIVLRLSAQDIELARARGQALVDATRELELDDLARTNQARPAARSLMIPPQLRPLATIALDGDGVSAPRGHVAVLAPGDHERRGVYAHRDMHPFDRADDVCRWPTVAVVDDARLKPNRTWSAAKQDDVWAQVTKAIRTASEEALATVGHAPPEALTAVRVTHELCADVKGLRPVVRGVTWLARGDYAVKHDLVVHGEGELDALLRTCHTRLIRVLIEEDVVDDDTLAAHVAHALANDIIKPASVSGIKFACFTSAIEARMLANMLRSDRPITTFVDDGSELARVLRPHFRDRLEAPKREAPKPVPVTPPANPPVTVQRPAPRPTPPPAPAAPPRTPHVLEPLVDALGRRIAQLGVKPAGIVVDDDAKAMLGIRKNVLVLGGTHARLRALTAELAAASILAGPGIDVLAAHAVSLLNIARTDITDATELHALGVLLAVRRT